MSITVARVEPSIAGVGDYIELMKPRVMSLVVFTAFVGLGWARVPMHPVIAFTALLCIAVGAGAAGALNMWYDADIDARMARTAGRPIPAGRLARGEALAFGLTLAGFSVVVLGLLVNVLAAILLAATIGFYVGIYTVWLKRLTPQNIVIGGARDKPRRSGAPRALCRRFPLGPRPGAGWGPSRSFSSPSFSCGRRRTSGRCRFIEPTTTRALASPCCRSWPVRPKPAVRSSITPSFWRPLRSRPGCSDMLARSMAWPPCWPVLR